MHMCHCMMKKDRKHFSSDNFLDLYMYYSMELFLCSLYFNYTGTPRFARLISTAQVEFVSHKLKFYFYNFFKKKCINK